MLLIAPFPRHQDSKTIFFIIISSPSLYTVGRKKDVWSFSRLNRPA